MTIYRAIDSVSNMIATEYKFFYLFFRRVIYAKKGVMLGHWEAEWSCTWDDLKERPKQHDEKVEFLLKVLSY